MLSVHVVNLMLGNLGFWVFSFLYLGLIYYGDFLDLCSYIDVTTPLQAYHVDVLHGEFCYCSAGNSYPEPKN